MQELFSQRYPVRTSTKKITYDSIPLEARNQFINLLTEFNRVGEVRWPPLSIGWRDFQGLLFKISDIKRSFEYKAQVAASQSKEIIQDCKWFTFLDICQITVNYFRANAIGNAINSVTELIKDINYLFQDFGIGYEIRNFQIERIGSTFTDKNTEKARLLLQDPRFSGPEEQFQRAIEAFSRRPEPDLANSTKDAIGAVEGVARIVTGETKATLSSLLSSNKMLKEMIPQPLTGIFEKVYAFRGNEEGVSHGQTALLKIDQEQTELVISACASLIIYLGKKAGAKTA